MGKNREGYEIQWHKEHPKQYILIRAKNRAKRAGIEFDITVDDIDIPVNCPITGIKLGEVRGDRLGDCPSLDRIDNTKGYVKGNVAVISHRANRLKSSLSIQEIENLYKYVHNS